MNPSVKPVDGVGVHHVAAAAVCDLLYALAIHPGWLGTREVAARSGLDRNGARRVLRELADHHWTLTRTDTDGTEQWRLGPTVQDLAFAYRRTLAARGAALDRELRELERPLQPYARAAVRPEVPAIEVSRALGTGRHHKGTAAVCQVVHALTADGSTTARQLLDAGVDAHRATLADILDELAQHGWVVPEVMGGAERWRLGPGLPRLAAQHAPFSLGLVAR